MEVVIAYPELELYPTDLSSLRSATGRRSRGRRHIVPSALRAARAVAFTPVLILGWFMLRLGWLARRSVPGARRLVAGTVGLVWDGLRAGGHGVLARLPLVGRNMAAATATGVVFVRAAAIGIWNGLVRTVHAIAARLGPAVEATVARVPLVRRSMIAAAAAGVAFAQAAAIGIRNRLVRTVHAIAARLGPAVEATVARVPLVRRNMVAAAAAGVAFARAVVLGIRDALVGTAHAVAAGLGAGVQTVAARVTLARRSLAAPAAATVAFAQAATHGIRSRLVRTVHAIAARLGAGVEAVARVPLVRRSMASATAAVVATEPAVAIGIPNAASRPPRALAPGIGTAVHAAIARIGIVGVTALDKARRGTASAMAFLRTSSAPAKAAAVSFARILTSGIRHVVVRTTALAGFALAVAVRAARRVGAHVAVTAALVGHGLVALARSAAEALRPVPVLVTGAAAEPDFTPVTRHASGARYALDNDARRPARIAKAAPVVRVTLAGVPAWARQLRTGSALVVALSLTIGLSVGVLFLLLSMQPAAPRAAGATLSEVSPSPIAAVVSPVVRPAANEARTRTVSDRGRPATVSTPPQAQAPSLSLSPAQVRAIWAKSDTRSLDLAFGALRSAPLALHRCDLLQTSANRAVAHCDEVPEGGAAASPQQRVTWTIKFRRVDDGWVIEDVSTARPRARTRRNR